MPTQLLSSRSSAREPVLALHPEAQLSLARAHEACGPARRTFALWLAERMQGPILWLSPPWESGRPNPDGMAAFADPGRFLFVHPNRNDDLLWCMEEALRSGAVPLVVADLPGPPGLTPVRRLHLAAEQGAMRGTPALGLLLCPGEGGAPGIETRWHMATAHLAKTQRWTLTRSRARTLPPKTWLATRKRSGGGLDLQTPATADRVGPDAEKVTGQFS
ncbi:hypothetical protein OEZ49_15480 [Ruegeria sp. WL0004]|uniref:Protein ImuA n=1 Tax=Ruegeria marisflavi TaxID=2984152 RepID=A0ABT2WTI2_9RHOB|nr:hypothetical protein [Ruegeria sp. WL0004]MCU9839176.1 hypothetical protein [Ruegeria sp. WL0004]